MLCAVAGFGPGAGPRLAADLKGRNEHAIASDKGFVADLRRVLGLTVVIGGDRPGPHVDASADVSTGMLDGCAMRAIASSAASACRSRP